jgi:hypothetical protein
MSNMNYAPVMPRSREDLDLAFASNDPVTIHDALISAAYWDEDWEWAQQKCLLFSGSADGVVRNAVALALSFIAVFHAKLDLAVVVPLLEAMKTHPETQSNAETALEDIEHFIIKLKGKHKAQRLPTDWRP